MTAKIKLDWSQILGFDQATRDGETVASEHHHDGRIAVLGTKVGGKSGSKTLGPAARPVAHD